MPGAASVPFEGRIPGFDNKWNWRQMDVISKEDKLRWQSLDKQMEIMAASGKPRVTVKLPRAHSSIGPYPGCRRLTTLSPRKSAAICYIEQKLCASSAEDPANPTMRETLYDGVSHEEMGRHQYLKSRSCTDLHHRYGDQPATSAQAIGFSRPPGEYKCSRFAHRPVIEGGFYRTNGTQTHVGLPRNSRD